MKIQCPNCQHGGDVPDDKIPDAGIKVSCPQCKEKFQVTKAASQDFVFEDQKPPEPQIIFCPKCGTEQPSSDKCVKCGILFAKVFNANIRNTPNQDVGQGEKHQSTSLVSGSPEFAPSKQGKTNSKGHDEKFCSDCGSTIKIRAEICPSCGVRQTPQRRVSATSNVNGKNRVTAILLALFLGGLGAHKFYLNDAKVGILYLLFCWTFIPAFFALYDLICYASVDDDEFCRKYVVA